MCVFRRDQALPILAVDEPIYRRLPCFIIATVDKFANLPWVGETGALFGQVTHFDSDGFYGPAGQGQGQRLVDRLPPPDLIIQDELHLISGPLGTMVGLYETAIDALASCDRNGKPLKPKIVASTATVRRATSQIRALFGRERVEVFPPPGPDRRDSFFSQTVPVTERNGRTYVGVAAQGRSLKVVLLRTYLALMAAAQKAWVDCGGDKNPKNPADPYMTLLGYFNSLRELGGSRRIVEDEVKARLENYSNRKRENEPEGLFCDRTISYEPVELTSRVSTSKVAAAKGRISQTFNPKDKVDVVLATNMISVGLDISRLGLMVVLGQPKTAAEYIQTTSRVGRDDQRPGLVVTLLNVHRPRDRSHYERFQAWHNTFYRAVEATSVTPFSPRALDRGLAGVTVALSRLGLDKMTAPLRAGEILQHRQELDFVVDTLAHRAEMHDKNLDAIAAEELRQKLRNRVQDLLDSWNHIAADKDGLLQYQQETGKAPPLLFDPLDPELDNQPKIARKFKAQRSLRDVEPTVNLWIKTLDGLDVEEEA
ncbi:MAG: helicase-related protein [Cyanobacteria bacterium P01_A01_bin.17]